MILQLGVEKVPLHLCNKITMYIWSSTMKKLFSKHLETIKEKIGVHFKSSKIIDQMLCFKNEHISLKSLKNLFFHKTPNAFKNVFLGTNYEIHCL
jgi:hypothetical protein